MYLILNKNLNVQVFNYYNIIQNQLIMEMNNGVNITIK